MRESNREYQKVIEYIRAKIESGELKSGSRMPTERVLSAELGIGRNSTREAFRILENMGIAASRQGSGNYIVCDMTRNLADVIDMMLSMRTMTQKDILSFRFYMEQTVCAMVLQNPEKKQRLMEAEKILAAFEAAPPDRQVELDREFHYFLVNATGNAMMIFLMESLLSVYRRWIDRALQRASDEDLCALRKAHAQILSGLSEDNPEAIHTAIVKHYEIIDKLLS